MPAIGFGMIWGGYTLLFWGWCQIKGYDISLAEIVVPKKWDGTWPPALINDGGSSDTPKVNPKDHPGDQGYNNDPNYGGTISSPSGKSSSSGGVFNA
jgi:hypothetical protein